MFDIVGIAFSRGIGLLFLLTWVLPAAIMLLAYVTYIIVKTVQEFWKD